MKLFTVIALVSLSIVATVNVAEARNSTRDAEKIGLDKKYQKKFYKFTCLNGMCGNWNVKS